MNARLLAALLAFACGAESAEPSSVREWRESNEHALLDELEGFLALPNLAHEREAIRKNAGHLREMLERRRLAPRLLEIDDPAMPPAVYGEWLVPGAKRTLVLYAHYDGQPVIESDWHTPPWQPSWLTKPRESGGVATQRDPSRPLDPDARLYARSASDDKVGVMAILFAIDALKAAGTSPGVNVKLFFDGEEESGSPHLAAVLERHRALLASDAWLICDGPMHASGRQPLVYGVRGVTRVDLTVYGATRALHSGHYGNWSPNPAEKLAHLLASMKDADGRVLVKGWADDVAPLGELERAALERIPHEDTKLRRDLGLAATDLDGMPIARTIGLPSLNVDGIRSADVGERASNVIPSTASATLDMRLVAGQAPGRQVERLRAHIAAQGYLVLDRAPTAQERSRHARIATLVQNHGGYAASRTPMDAPIARSVRAAIETVRPDMLDQPTMGGSLPLSVITEVLGAPTLVVPIANPDNNQHAANENLRLGNLWDGIELMAAVMRGTR